MQRIRLTSAILAAAAATVLGLSLADVASASAHPGTSSQAAAVQPRVVVLDCLGKPQVKPRDFVLTCADGNSALTKMAWNTWTPAMASAGGTLVENDCIPSCVGGHFHSYPVLAVLWGPAAYQHGKRFSRLTLLFPGARPRIFNGHRWVPGPLTVTYPLWAS